MIKHKLTAAELALFNQCPSFPALELEWRAEGAHKSITRAQQAWRRRLALRGCVAREAADIERAVRGFNYDKYCQFCQVISARLEKFDRPYPKSLDNKIVSK